METREKAAAVKADGHWGIYTRNILDELVFLGMRHNPLLTPLSLNDQGQVF